MIHASIERITAQFEAQALHAARSGREVMQAFARLAADTHAASLDDFADEVRANSVALLSAMPAYAPPLNVLHLVFTRLAEAQSAGQSVGAFQAILAREAAGYERWSEQARASIAAQAAALIPVDGTVFTFTLSETVLGTLRAARRNGREFSVIVTESRPNNDGADTTRLLAEAGVPVALGLDAAAGALVRRADVMLVGAEAILSDGSAICKVGTYPAALAARQSGVPVYVLVDSRKFHPLSLWGQPLALDAIGPAALGASGAAAPASVVGHLFDRTPAGLIRGLVTERGVLHPAQAAGWMLTMPLSPLVAALQGV